MTAHPNKGDFWQGAPKPKTEPVTDTWWARPAVQTDRAAFHEVLEAELPRLISHPRFGGWDQSP